MKSVFQTFISGFKEGFSIFGLNFGSLVNLVILSVVYLLGIGLTAIIAKLFKKHFLDLLIHSKQQSYWENVKDQSDDINQYLRRF